MHPSPKFLLASQSPRRQSLLKRLLPEFEVATADVEEWSDHPNGPKALASTNATLKADPIAREYPTHWVIGSDTVVEWNGCPLGKPTNRHDAVRMIRQLSGRKHNVHTGVTICQASSHTTLTFAETSEVVFFKLDAATIDHYVDTMHPQQYAGGYPIQYLLGSLVSGFDGSYTNVVGLPLERLQLSLNQLGLLPQGTDC